MNERIFLLTSHWLQSILMKQFFNLFYLGRPPVHIDLQVTIIMLIYTQNLAQKKKNNKLKYVNDYNHRILI